MVSEYCSACVSRVGFFSTNNRTVLGQPPQLYSEPLQTVLGRGNSPEKSFEAVALLVGFPSENPLKINGTFIEPYNKPYSTPPERVCRSIDEDVPRVAISAAIYRGAKCPTLKTAEKQPKRVPSGSQRNSRKTAEKQPENSCFDCFSGVSGCFPAVFRLFYRDPLGTLSGNFSAVFNVGHLAPL